MLLRTYYAHFNAGIIGSPLSYSNTIIYKTLPQHMDTLPFIPTLPTPPIIFIQRFCRLANTKFLPEVQQKFF